jgi:hypothetical protein
MLVANQHGVAKPGPPCCLLLLLLSRMTSNTRPHTQLSPSQLPWPAAAAASIIAITIETQLWLWQTQLLESCPQVVLPLIYQMLQLIMQLLQELLLISCRSIC